MYNVYGLGPAGSTFITSLRKGVYAHDLMWEKHGRLRSCCAGGMGFWAIEEIKKSLDFHTWTTIHNVICTALQTVVERIEYVGVHTRVEVSAEDLGVPYLGVVVDRARFDEELAKLASKYVEYKSHIANFKTVVATGFSGMPKIPRRDVEVTYQQWIEAKDLQEHITLSIVKDYSESGYFWVFPEVKNGVLKVGVGESLEVLEKRGVSIRQVLEKFKKMLKVDGRVVRECGALLPLSKWRKEYMYRDGKVYIGTAGGFVNPLTGAGIKHAIMSAYAYATGNERIVRSLAREINRSYVLKKLVVGLPQERLDRAIKLLSNNIWMLNLSNIASLKNLILAIIAML